MLNCDIDRISSLVDSEELDRARVYLADVAAQVRTRYGELKTPAWAWAVSSILDLEIRIDLGSAKDATDNTRILLNNTQEFAQLLQTHLTFDLADRYSTRIFMLVEEMEKASDFKASAAATAEAAKLLEALARVEWDTGKETEEDALARRNFGFRTAAMLYRRLGWISAEKLDAATVGLDAATTAIAVAQAGLPLAVRGSDQFISLRWEEMLGEEVRGTALLRLGRLKEGVEADKRGLAISDDILTLDIDEVQRQNLEQERNFLGPRIVETMTAIEGGQP